MRLSFSDVQRNVSEIANRQSYSTDVLYELMAAYGRSASSITKLRNGIINLAEDKQSTVLQRGVVYLKDTGSVESLPAEVEKLEQDPLTARYNPRFLIATDFKTFAAKDTKKGNTLEIAWEDIDRNVDFFYGWTGDEVTDEKTEAVADRRAADKMKELYYEIEKINRDKLAEKGSTFRHDLNVFFTRLLFCFFAEDTKVFSKENRSIFTSAIKDYTLTDGTDLDDFLNTLFNSLDSEDKSSFTSPFSNFPYVNGTLFDTSRNIAIPKFNAQARKYILDCGSLNWAEINPDIFGSMFQSIVDEEHRATHGQHYTSVPNIMKTIEPLFLDELREEFDKHYDNQSKLIKLHDRISKIKVFDPACGSGNFLIIAYKELRKLEHAIIERLYEDDFKKAALAGRLSTRIDLDNFYGIEIDDFACEVAVLSLYLAKHQMNIEFEKQFGKEIKLIPLKDKANVVRGNAARLDWQDVCPNIEHTTEVLKVNEQSSLIEFEDEQPSLKLGEKYWDEIYLIGNPPYQGFSQQSVDQKADLQSLLGSTTKMDYISIWFIKASNFIKNTKAKYAFVSTNSITQGEQVALLWPKVLIAENNIDFAYTSFKWQNNAKGNAGVTVVIIGVAPYDNPKRSLYTDGVNTTVDFINPYLTSTRIPYVNKRSNPLSTQLPPMVLGDMPNDYGALQFSQEEYSRIIDENPEVKNFFRRVYGSQEFIKGQVRWCLWIDEQEYQIAKAIPALAERFNHCRTERAKSKKSSYNKFADRPYRFIEIRHKETPSIIVPGTSSERREYIPMGLMNHDVIVNNLAFAVYDAQPWLFGILTSKMHDVWIRNVCGSLETRLRYSSVLGYNTFPIQHLSVEEQNDISVKARGVLFARENHSEKTLADMYDPNKMPEDLKQAHHDLDMSIDRLYRQKPYANDEERLADLFELYEQMIEREKK